MTNNYYESQPSQDTLSYSSPKKSSSFHGSKQQWPSQVLGSTTQNMDGCEDIIEDDYDSFDELFTQYLTDEKNILNLGGTRPPSKYQEKRASHSQATNASRHEKPGHTARRFLLPPESQPSCSLPSEKDNLSWTEEYAPLNLKELAVHKKKVCDVERWLENALVVGNQGKLLVLKGPAGSGKTTTLSLLSDKLNFDILEWKTPSVSEFGTKGYTSLAAQFDEFLSRGNAFGSLDLAGSNDSRKSVEDKTITSQRRVILIEEFPTWSGRNSSSLVTFRLSLLRYISMSTMPQSNALEVESDRRAASPVIMIVSETFSNSSPLDSFTVHRLLGREIYHHSNTTIIDFNGIAPTFMYKALNLVLEKNSHSSQLHQIPGRSMLEEISKVGDIRNAVASLEFICLGSKNQSSRTNRTKRAKSPFQTRKIPTYTESETLKAITQREFNLGLFHAVGKIVYNKRDVVTPSTEHLHLPPPPDHLPHYNRPKVSQVSVNKLIDETGTDPQSFVSALHENYVLSCSGPSFTECLDECIRALSDSDMLSAGHKDSGRSRAGLGISIIKPGMGVDFLRQDDISYQVAARGLLFSLPCPVRRQMSSTDNTKRASNTHRIHPPSFFRLLHHMEDLQSLIGSWARILVDPSRIPTAFHASHTGNTMSVRKLHPGQEYSQERVTMTMMPRSDIILHQLPYIAMISGDEVESREIKRITGFSTVEAHNQSHGDISYPDEDLIFESSSRNQSLAQSSRTQDIRYQNNVKDGGLFLSDDDIVDDF